MEIFNNDIPKGLQNRFKKDGIPFQEVNISKSPVLLQIPEENKESSGQSFQQISSVENSN